MVSFFFNLFSFHFSWSNTGNKEQCLWLWNESPGINQVSCFECSVIFFFFHAIFFYKKLNQTQNEGIQDRCWMLKLVSVQRLVEILLKDSTIYQRSKRTFRILVNRLINFLNFFGQWAGMIRNWTHYSSFLELETFLHSKVIWILLLKVEGENISKKWILDL